MFDLISGLLAYVILGQKPPNTPNPLDHKSHTSVTEFEMENSKTQSPVPTTVQNSVEIAFPAYYLIDFFISVHNTVNNILKKNSYNWNRSSAFELRHSGCTAGGGGVTCCQQFTNRPDEVSEMIKQ